MRHILSWILIVSSLLLTGCDRQQLQITNLSLLEGGKTFAVPTGTVADQFVLQRFSNAKIKYFNSAYDCAVAVREGKADAAAYDKPILQNIAAKNDGLIVLDELLVDDKYGFAVQLQNLKLKTVIDQVLAELQSDGTYEDMMKRWFPEKGVPAPMPVIELSGKNGILKFGTAAVTEPMSFMDENKNIVGFDIEFATYIARKLGRQLEIVDMEFGAMLPALSAGKVDMIGAGLSITEERAKSVLFSNSYYPSGIAAIVRDYSYKKQAKTDLKMTGVEDIKDRRIGVLTGSIYDPYVTKNFPNAIAMNYQSYPDMLIALNTEKVDVGILDHSATKDLFDINPKLGYLVESLFTVPIAAGFSKVDIRLREEFNAFLQQLKINGVYDDMIERWDRKGLKEMPVIENKNPNGVLRAGIVSDIGMPHTIMQDGRPIGLDIELGERFAAYLGREYIPVDMQFSSLIAALVTRKIDMITSGIMITEERKKQIDFSDPYYESGVSLIALKKNIAHHAVTHGAILATIDDLADKKIGIFTGTVQDAFIAQKYPQAKILRYESTADLMMSVKTGKIDGAMLDLITARLLIKHNPELTLLSDNIFNTPLGVGFNKKNPDLRNEFNAYLKEIRRDGSYDIMYKRWFIEDAENAVMPVIEPSGVGKKLFIGVAVGDLPYVAYMNGRYVGFDIEMIAKFAERNNYKIEFVQMEFPALIAALTAGKVQMIADGISISEERQKQIDFSEPYAQFQAAVIVSRNRHADFAGGKDLVSKRTFLQGVSESFHNNIVLENRFLLIIDGLKVTIVISIFSALVGTLLGGLICLMRMAKHKLPVKISEFYITLLRGTPVLVLLMIIYYVVFASVNINPVIVAIIAFGLNFAAYVSEMFRTSIESIDKGQSEAGIAGGFTKVQTFFYIIMPQALRNVLPVYKGEFISLVKMTSIVGYIAVQDLTKAGDIIRSRTFDAFFPLIMAAMLYLLIAWLLTWALSQIEISVDPKRKRIVREREVN